MQSDRHMNTQCTLGGKMSTRGDAVRACTRAASVAGCACLADAAKPHIATDALILGVKLTLGGSQTDARALSALLPQNLLEFLTPAHALIKSK